jgi:hypothetical protein
MAFSAAVDEITWHKRFGHLNMQDVRALIKNSASRCGMKVKSTSIRAGHDHLFCECCTMIKSHALPQDHQQFVPDNTPLATGYLDLHGKIGKSMHGDVFNAVFVDGASRLVAGATMNTKSQTPQLVKQMVRQMQAEIKQHLGVLYTDGATELHSKEMIKFAAKNGTELRRPHPYSKARFNPVVERAIRTVMEMTRALLLQAKLDQRFWVYAFHCAIFLRNRSPCATLGDKSPLQVWNPSREPDVSFLRVFGCDCWVLDEANQSRRKDEPRVVFAIFVGYDTSSACYLVWVPSTKRERRTVNVVFREDKFTRPPPTKPSFELKLPEANFMVPGSHEKRMKTQEIIRDILNAPLLNIKGFQSPLIPRVELEQKESNENEDQEQEQHSIADMNDEVKEDQSVEERKTQEIDEDICIPQTQEADDRQVYSLYSTTTPLLNPFVMSCFVTAVSSVGEDRQQAHAQWNTHLFPQNYDAAAEMLWCCVAGVSFIESPKDSDPRNYREAINHPRFAQQWKEAIDDEHNSLLKMRAWEAVDSLPPGQKALHSTYVFKTKRDKNGALDKYKARLCVMGNRQRSGIDVGETFAPTLNYEALRILLALALSEDLVMEHIDVKCAFLNGTVEEMVYMHVPEGLKHQYAPGTILRLVVSLYGLKQAPRCWNKKLCDTLAELGLQPISADPCIFLRMYPNGDKLIVPAFVDDLLPMATTQEILDEFKEQIGKKFKTTNLGAVSFFLGVAIQRSKDELRISQEAYIEDILERFGWQNMSTISTPCPTELLVREDDDADVEKSRKDPTVKYRELVGALLFLSVVSRPDIAHAVNQAAAFLDRHGTKHWQAVKRIVRYVQGTKNLGLIYRKGGKSASSFFGFADSSYSDCIDTAKSTSGVVFYFAGAPVSWRSSKQTAVALSSVEAEYMALAAAARQAIWMRRLLCDLGVLEDGDEATLIGEDNQGAIHLLHNPSSSRRTRHINVSFHFAREHIQNKQIRVEYVHTKDQPADILTKYLKPQLFLEARKRLLCQPLNAPELHVLR